MKMCRHSSSDIHKLPYTLRPRSLMEIPSRNRFPVVSSKPIDQSQVRFRLTSKAKDRPNNIIIRPSRNDLHLLEIHDILQLYTDLPRLPEKFGMQEVSQSPIITEPTRTRRQLSVSQINIIMINKDATTLPHRTNRKSMASNQEQGKKHISLKKPTHDSSTD
jgi:hypothetical protein